MEPPLNGDFEGSFTFEAHYLELPHARLHYVDEGPRDAAPVVLLHGNATWAYMYRRQLAELPRLGHRTIAFDHMGFGRSEKPPHLGAYSLERHVENAAALLSELDLRDAVLVMHDWGGPIGLGAALAQRERLRGLVIMNSWAWELPSILPPFLREFRSDGLGEILVLGGNLLVESIPGGMAERDTDPLMMDAYRAPFPDYWSRVGMLAFQREIPLSERDASAATMRAIHDGLSGLGLPARCIWGMRDPVFQPVFLDQWRELLDGLDVVELDDAAHYLVEDRPDAVTEAIDGFARSLTI